MTHSAPGRRMAGPLLAVGLLFSALAFVAPPTVAADPTGPPSRSQVGLPRVSPTPQEISREGRDVVVPGRVDVVIGADTDEAARALLVRTLRQRGVDRVDVVARPGSAPVSVLLGAADREDIVSGLGDTRVPDHDEGYALRVDRAGDRTGRVTLGGTDPTGQYYAVHTLRQLFVPVGDGWRIAGAAVSDYPAMPLRGSIEGFYGQPWSHEERLDQLAFYGDVKANTYIYAPKDDPFHRERWREPYPAEKLAELAELVDQARAHHVRFTFALSPGNSICYTGAADRAALLEKFEAMHAIGVRAFSIPLDDIALRFNCAEDSARYGAATQSSVGRAQAELLSFVQESFVETSADTKPLQTVPTQYGDLAETPYKQSWRAYLAPKVVVMWTGTDVVPPEITVAQAQRISELYGRDVFVWDNYPVNDFGQTAGRLLLAPYDKREPGLSSELVGIVSNPMNQAYASKLAMFTMFDFAWNDRGFHRPTSAHLSAAYLAGGDPEVTDAVETFVDLNHAAPTFGACDFWQPQAPKLNERLQQFWSEWDSGEDGALAGVRPTVDAIEGAPALIRSGTSPGFVSDAAPQLQATQLWGASMQAALDVLAGIRAEDGAAALAARDRMEQLASTASQIQSTPGKNRVEGPVKIGDGVIDIFIQEVAAEHDRWRGIPPRLYTWWSGNDQNWADIKLTRTLEVPAGSTDARFWMRNDYVIESDWDYGFVEMSSDGGSTWTELKVYDQAGNEVSTPDNYPDPNGRLADYGDKKYGLTGSTGGWARHYVDLTPYAGHTIGLRLRYATDQGALERGWFADDFSLTSNGTTVWSDDVESGAASWTATGGTWTDTTGNGWRIVKGQPSTCPVEATAPR